MLGRALDQRELHLRAQHDITCVHQLLLDRNARWQLARAPLHGSLRVGEVLRDRRLALRHPDEFARLVAGPARGLGGDQPDARRIGDEVGERLPLVEHAAREMNLLSVCGEELLDGLGGVEDEALGHLDGRSIAP